MSMVKMFKRRASVPAVLEGSGETYSKPKPQLTKSFTQDCIKIPEAIPWIPKVMPKYYVKDLNREAAENLLEQQPVGTFLLRDRQSSKVPGSYTLSMRDKNNQCRHFKIDTDPRDRKLSIHGYEDIHFGNLETLMSFFVQNQGSGVHMMPYLEFASKSVLYEDMNENNTELNSDSSIQAPFSGVAMPTTPSYENINKKGGTRRPPPPEPLPTENQYYENINPKPRASTLPFKSTQGPYENLPEKPDVLPLPPSRQAPMGGFIDAKRRGSLPIRLGNHLSRQPPPPLPARPHDSSVNYENLPVKGSTTDSSRYQQKRNQLRRSYTEGDKMF